MGSRAQTNVPRPALASRPLLLSAYESTNRALHLAFLQSPVKGGGDVGTDYPITEIGRRWLGGVPEVVM